MGTGYGQMPPQSPIGMYGGPPPQSRFGPPIASYQRARSAPSRQFSQQIDASDAMKKIAQSTSE